MHCNRLAVTLASMLSAAEPWEQAALDKAILELEEGHKLNEVATRDIVIVQEAHAETGVSRQRIAEHLRLRGYRHEVIRYNKHNHRVWAAPHCKHPKLVLHQLITQREKAHVPVSRS